jgi:hypothetical protein
MSLGISIYSLPLVVTLLLFILLTRKQQRPIIFWLPSLGFLLSSMLIVFQPSAGFALAATFAIFSLIALIQTRSGFKFITGPLLQALYMLMGVFAIETLLTDSVFKIFWGLTSLLFLQMFRNYLATDSKKHTSIELASYWLVIIVFWWVLILHPEFQLQLLLNKETPRSMTLFLFGSSIFSLFMLYIPWKGFRNLADLNWLNASLLFHVLLIAKYIFQTEFFHSQLFVGSYSTDSVRWLLFLMPILLAFIINKNTNGQRRIASSSFFSSILLILFYSMLPLNNNHVLFVGILIIAVGMLLQNYAFQMHSPDLEIRNGFSSRIFLITSLFTSLVPLSGALREFFPQICANIIKWEEYATLFYFPSALIIILMLLSIVNALIICNDKLSLTHQDAWTLTKSDIIIAFILLPFIFLGIYPSPLYNYIQKYLIFP